MDFITLKKRAAKHLNLLDSNGAILTGKDITATKLGESINDAYLEEIYPALQNQYPHDFEQLGVAANYTVSDTVDNASTGTTLVASNTIFKLGMVGLYVYNVDLSIYAKITAYTNTTTVTLDTTIGNDWDGDTIKIIDPVIPFGGDATDLYAIREVYVRYTTTGEYLRATPRFHKDLFQTGLESFPNNAPIYVLGTADVSGVSTKSIEIIPNWTTPDDYAVKILYLEKPSLLSADADVPILPVGHHAFLAWYAVKEAAALRRDTKLYQVADAEFQKGKTNLLKNYRPTSFDSNVISRIPRRWASLYYRTK